MKPRLGVLIGTAARIIQRINFFLIGLQVGKHGKLSLCSMQYTEDVLQTLRYLHDQRFSLYVQWLNPGWSDDGCFWDRLGLTSRILAERSVIGIRNGKVNSTARMAELREHIYGWALFRGLIEGN